MRRIIVGAVLLAALAAGCSEGKTAAPIATTQPAPTTTVVVISRDTRVAVQDCVTQMRSVGLALLANLTDRADAAMEACKDAQTQLDVDDRGAVGKSATNELGVLIAEQNMKVASLNLAAATGTLSGDKAGELDAGYVAWADKVETLLNQG